MLNLRPVVLLARSCHLGPTLAVTALTALLAVRADHHPLRTALIVLAVLSGQLTIGWSNDLIDAERDRSVGRLDKPLATGELSVTNVRLALAVALIGCLVFSLLFGFWSGAAHLILVVGSGWAYNLGLKRTAASFIPYAVAFAALPAVVTLALVPPRLPPIWMLLTGALLGVGGHLVNALPDLADDAATGVSGLPHRLGDRLARAVAAAALAGGSLVATFGPAGALPPWAWVGLLLVVALVIVILSGKGKTPFLAAIGVALIDVAILVVRS